MSDTPEQRIRKVVGRKLDFEVCYCQAVRTMKQEDGEGRLVEVDARRIVKIVARGLSTDIARALEATLDAEDSTAGQLQRDTFVAELERDV